MHVLWGRADSSAVARVAWTLGELGLEFKRIDAGGAFGGLDEPSYRVMNPPGRVPTLVTPSGEALWESKSIIRFLASQYGDGALYPPDPLARAKTEAWMDWSDAFGGAVGRIRTAYRTPGVTLEAALAAVRREEPVLGVLDRQLAGSPYVAGSGLTVADLALGVWGHRLKRCPAELQASRFSAIMDWWGRLSERPAFKAHVMQAVSAGPQHLASARPT